MKVINVDFLGGPWDGQMLSGNSLDHDESRLAKKCFWNTQQGAVGTRFPPLSSREIHLLRKRAAANNHFGTNDDYVVAVRMETDKEIRVTFESAREPFDQVA